MIFGFQASIPYTSKDIHIDIHARTFYNGCPYNISMNGYPYVYGY